MDYGIRVRFTLIRHLVRSQFTRNNSNLFCPYYKVRKANFGPLKSCMVTWAGLGTSSRWVYLLNRHFSNAILGMFFTMHSLGKRANRKLKHF